MLQGIIVLCASVLCCIVLAVLNHYHDRHYSARLKKLRQERVDLEEERVQIEKELSDLISKREKNENE